MSQNTQTSFLEAFERRAAESSGAPEALTALRRRAIETFAELGLPSRKDEPWMYTKLAPILRDDFVHAATDASRDVDAPFDAFAHRLVFVDGRFDAKRSTRTPDGVVAKPLSEALSDPRAKALANRALEREADGFWALNAAFSHDGVFLDISGECDEPLAVFFVASDTADLAVHPLNIVACREDSSARIVEIFVGGAERHLQNSDTRIELGERATLDHTRVVMEGAKGLHLGRISVEQREGSRLDATQFALSGHVVRNHVAVEFAHANAEANLSGLYLAGPEQSIDNYTTLHHNATDCTSRENYKGIIDGNGVGAFTGRVIVEEHAHRSVAHQKNRNLLLSEDGTANSRPQLEIYAKEVEASHGATVGQLEEAQLFYLRSRGLTEREAEALLQLAFASELVEAITDRQTREFVEARVLSRLAVSPELREAIRGLDDEARSPDDEGGEDNV